MIKELNDKINSINNKILSKSIIQKRIKETRNEIREKKLEIIDFEDVLKKEKKDIDKLQGFTLSNLISTITRNKQIKLSQEEREYLDAKIKNDSLQFELNELEYYYNKKKSELVNIEKLTIEYNNLLEEKKSLIINESPNNKTIINSKNNKASALKKQLIEINEAIYAGDNCLNYLRKSQKSLQSASSWGTADILMRKSIFVSIIKHQKISKASRYISQTKQAISKYNKEIKDINFNSVKHNIETASSMKMFDIFFDNIFTDIYVQNKIKNSLSEISKTVHTINRTVTRLKRIKTELTKEINYLEKEIDNIIINYE